MRIRSAPSSFLAVLAVGVYIMSCSTGQPLPASWPDIGITLPRSAEVKELHETFRLYTHDKVHAYRQDGEIELWAVCFSCPNGITEAHLHISPELLRGGFTEVLEEDEEDIPETYPGKMIGHERIEHLWISENERIMVTLNCFADLSEEARKTTGELCLSITAVESGRSRLPGVDQTDHSYFRNTPQTRMP